MKKQKYQRLNYSHRFYPNKTQQALLDADMFAANQVYNITLQLLYQEYETFCKQGKSKKFEWLNNTELDRKITQALAQRKLYIPLDAKQGERMIARKAFKDGLNPKNEKGLPKYRKSTKLHGAFSWTNARTKIKDNKFKLSKRYGWIKFVKERNFPDNSKLKTVRIKKVNEEYYVVFSLELLDKPILTINDFKDKIDNSLGMDTNNGHLDFSDGTTLKYPRSLNETELKRKKDKHSKKLLKVLNKITRLQKQQSKREEKAKKEKSKLGKNYYKTQKKINKIYKKQRNKRKNTLDKLSNEILSKAFDVLFIENLNVKEMTKKTKSKKMQQMKKNILNFSYSSLHQMLIYKAMLTDRFVFPVDPHNTTKTCSHCGSIKTMELSDRKYICDCGLNIDRDLNSAINIHKRGLSFVEALTVSVS